MAIHGGQARQHGTRPLLAGREREQAQLRTLLDDANTGHGSLVLISGEAGIGKTTLVNDLVQHAKEQGCLVLTGGCYDLATTPPYGPWSETIRGYRPHEDQPAVPAWFGNPDAMAEVGSQIALFEEARQFFAAIAKHQPLVIVLEDLHWADSASLEALRYLSRTLGEAGILLIVSYREDELTRRHELYQLLPLLVRESPAQRIHLHRLERDDIREMVASRYALEASRRDRLVRHVTERSEGNPFFAEEILQGLENERLLQPANGIWTLGNLERVRVPMLLRQTLDMRLERLSPELRDALRVAAVIGHVVSIDLWQEITELSEADFDRVMTEALESHILEEAPSTNNLQFRHALLREALYESLTLSRRRAWHRKLGETHSEIPNVDPDTVAYHFQEAGDAQAMHWLIRAGMRAERSYALQVAAGHYARAQVLLEADPDMAQERGWLLLHTGHLLRYSDHERSIAYLEDAAEVARQVDDPVLEAHSQTRHGLLRCFQGETGRGLSEMESANTIMDSVTAAQEERSRQAIVSLFPAELLSSPTASPGGGTLFKIGRLAGINALTQTYVLWLANAGRFQEAMRIGTAFVEQVAATTDDTLLIQDNCRDAYNGLAVAADWLGQLEEARRWRILALDAYRAIGHRVLVRYVLHHELEHLLAYHADRISERRHAAEGASAEIDGQARWSGTLVDLLEGRWDAAREVFQETFSVQTHEAQSFRAWIYNVLGAEQDDDEFATTIQADIQDVLPRGPASEPGPEQRNSMNYSVAAHQAAVKIALAAGELDRARDWITSFGRWLDWADAVLGRAEEHLLWAHYYRAAGDLDRAGEHAGQALARASDPRQPLALIAVQRLLGELATEAGRYDDAADHLQTALNLAERCEAVYERALTLLALAELAAVQDDTQTAARLLREARTILQDLGAKRSLVRADQIESNIRYQPTDHPAGLSAREVEVLEQAATGMTNAEIGETLYISPRTVAQHLRSVYNKLGVNSRAAAVARWAELMNG